MWGERETKNFPEGDVEENEIFRSLHLNKVERKRGAAATRAPWPARLSGGRGVALRDIQSDEAILFYRCIHTAGLASIRQTVSEGLT
jgi:hypothetical protein